MPRQYDFAQTLIAVVFCQYLMLTAQSFNYINQIYFKPCLLMIYQQINNFYFEYLQELNPLMKNSQVSTRNKINLGEQTSLDPLEINQLIFEERIFLPLFSPENQEPNVHPFIFKITRAKNMDKLIIYILSEADLYFLYRIDLTYEQMLELNHQYKLSLKKLTDFVEFMKLSLEDIQNQQKFGIVQLDNEYNQSKIVFILKKIVAGKSHIVMTLQGQKESQEFIKINVAYKYGSIRQKIMKKEQRIEQLKEMVRLKNPYLLKNFKQI